MTDLDNTRSMPTRPDLDKLRAGVGAHQAAAYVEYLESLPCQAAPAPAGSKLIRWMFTGSRPDTSKQAPPAPTSADMEFIRRMLSKYAVDPRTTERDALVAREVLRRIS